jgi:hypothetical protein
VVLYVVFRISYVEWELALCVKVVMALLEVTVQIVVYTVEWWYILILREGKG